MLPDRPLNGAAGSFTDAKIAVLPAKGCRQCSIVAGSFAVNAGSYEKY